MCGIEILLCCAAGGAAGCCAKNKMDKNGKGKSAKVKGEGEAYSKTAKENKRPKKSARNKEDRHEQNPQYRIPAYEMYQAKYAQPASEKVINKEESGLHRRSLGASVSKGGQMDAEEFGRLKQTQQRQKLSSLR